jgi:hypothetical protein
MSANQEKIWDTESLLFLFDKFFNGGILFTHTYLSANSKPVVTRGRKATDPVKDGRVAEKRASHDEQTPFT